MKEYKKLHSSSQPLPVEITRDAVYESTNIIPYNEVIDGYTFNGYEYDCIEYTKDEYLLKQNESIAELKDELRAAKILLGVD